MNRAFKFLSTGGIGLHSGFAWPLPSADGPGAWVEAVGELLPCGNGVHASRADDLPYWIDDELWIVEVDGDLREEERGLVARRGRLVRQITGWDGRAAFELARDCADRARRNAADVLAEAGLDDDAVRRAPELESISRALLAASRRADGFQARVAGYAGDVARYAIDAEREGADWAGCAAYVDAYLAGYVASGGAAKHPDHEAAFFEVRRDQAAWFVERFDL